MKPTPKKTAAKKAAPKKAAHPLKAVAKAVADTTPTGPSPQERYRNCVAEVNEVLARHRCQIVAALNPPEAIGGEPTSKMMVSATWGIMPEQ